MTIILILAFHSYSFGKSHLKVTDLEDFFFFNRVISVVSVVRRETMLTISDSTGEAVSIEFSLV